ncbi:16S rRNA (guanine(527)-N(7))-methyltransferase RsmG [Glaciecola sp. MH2013]|uniref:16S rRNA (guanine(527)-N(7))-methyltransferase RsmG n=1 Tax=Glaciecola sp. MH2013 TaxID=2785524 RepID=UPI0018A025C7|nr:16S rRNA (guanine(527)-N(7))-methyltransferase RsmG [Glaciecola sp. MH2013]MBF7074645.1 16S rRNA (guanine(527)-N(7))-methyltransferase RsmG [Glaciecola sp. MH2013]
MDALYSTLSASFKRISKNLNFDITDDQQDKLIRYVLMINKWNKAYNLTSVRDPEEMLVKHIFDSIVVSPYLEGQYFADVGTGPGLPGIPLAIMNPDKDFLLVDSLGKRIRFIKQSLYELQIDNVKAVQSRVEELELDKALDGVLSRAFASLKDMLFWCQNLTDAQGQFLALKGQLNQLELDEIPTGFKVVNSINLSVPTLQGERHLLVVQKVQ